MKKCNKCEQIKELSLFGVDNRNKDGKQGICELCKTENKRKLRLERIEKQDYKNIKEKQCNTCKVTKNIDLFFSDKAMSDGHSSICKECKTKKVYEWREKNKDLYNKSHKDYAAKHYTRLRLLRYNLTPEQHAKMLYEQKGVCAICNNPPMGKRPLVIDHRHSDGKVRGLLCYGCNRALHILEQADLLEVALAYLKKYE